MARSITAEELVDNGILDCSRSDHSAERISATLATRVLGHRSIAGAGISRVSGRATWSFLGGFGDGLEVGTMVDGKPSSEASLFIDALRNHYCVEPITALDVASVSLPEDVTLHVFGLHDPVLAVLYIVTSDGELGFSPAAIHLIRHTAERCLTRTGTLSSAIEQTTELSAPDEEAFFSPRQMEVLTLLAEGKSNTEIGRALSVSASLAKQEVAFLMHALKARSRLDVVVQAQRRGLLPVAMNPA